MISSIATVIDNAEAGGRFAQALVEAVLGRRASASLTLLTPTPMVSPDLAPLGGLYIPLPELRSDADAAMERVAAALGARAGQVALHSLYGDVSRLAHELPTGDTIVDLNVIGASATWQVEYLRRASIETLLLASGTPLLLLPEGGMLAPFHHVVLGWRRSAQATCAVHALVALAEPGARIDIVTIGSRPAPAPQERCGIRDYLSGHGFACECHALPDTGSVAEGLQQFALDRGADLLTVGGYAHSRIREIVLGGTTRKLERQPLLPVLMAH